VLDQTGALLTDGEGSRGGGLDAQQLQYVNQIESGYNKRIFDLLEPIVGRDNLRASVTADVDFSQTEATSEEFKPNQGADASISIRSQQTTEQVGTGAAPATGIPGAATNQPPTAATAPLTGASQPLNAAQTGAGGSSRRDATTNYEVDKTVRVTRNATGTVKRLNAAVVVNHRTSTDAKGKTTTVPLTPEEIEKITTLVQESIGFKQDRGDSVKVINAPFKVNAVEKIDIPIWKQPETIDLLRTLAAPLALAVLGLVVFFGLVRPALKAALPKPPEKAEPGSTLNAVVDDEQSLANETPALAGPSSAELLQTARGLAKENPEAVATMVRGWVSGEAT
jgi:flagellar M-ring protein FliF